MKSKYILSLYKQYCSSKGKTYDKFNILNDIDFLVWIKSLHNQTIIYSDYLRYLNVSLSKDSTIEDDKGKYDSIGEKLTTIVSPFAETLGYQNSQMLVTDEGPLIFMGSSIFNANGCDLFLTHNPFNLVIINKMALLHNIGLNICFGVYGNVTDADKELKLKTIEELFEKVSDGLEIYYDTLDDNYFACIKSERNVKKKTLVR